MGFVIIICNEEEKINYQIFYSTEYKQNFNLNGFLSTKSYNLLLPLFYHSLSRMKQCDLLINNCINKRNFRKRNTSENTIIFFSIKLNQISLA